MSTHASITLEKMDGTKTSIYCHYDGYIEWAGIVLQRYYYTVEKIEELLELGDLSQLGETLEKCDAYHRDHGEKLKHSCVRGEYNYTFRESDGAWFVEYDVYKKLHSHVLEEIMGDVSVDNYEHRNNYLIDEIKNNKDRIFKLWENNSIVDECIEKAIEPVRVANYRKAEEYDSWYRAYAD